MSALEDVNKFLEFLSAKRLWLFIGLFAAAAVAQWSPDFGELKLSLLRNRYEPYIAATLLISGSLSVTSALSLALTPILSWAKRRRSNIVVSIHGEGSVWNQTLLAGDKTSTMVNIRGLLFNPAPGQSVRIVNVELRRPRLGTAKLSPLPVFGIGDAFGKMSPNNFVSPGATREFYVALFVEGFPEMTPTSRQVQVRLIDQRGRAHTIKATLPPG